MAKVLPEIDAGDGFNYQASFSLSRDMSTKVYETTETPYIDLAGTINTTNFDTSTVYHVRIHIGGGDGNYVIYNRSYASGHTDCYISSSSQIQLNLHLGLSHNGVAGTKTVYATLYDRLGYELKTIKLTTFTVLSPIRSLTITGLTTGWWVNQNLSLSGVTVYGNRENGEQVTISSYSTSISAGHKFASSEVGEQTLTFTYGSGTNAITQDVTINVYGLDRIELSGSIANFKQGTAFAFGNPLVVTAYFTNGTSNVIGSANYSFSNKDHNANDTLSITGDYSYTVSYTDNVHGTGMTAEATATYSVYGLSSISISEDNISFNAGGKFSYGGTITANYSNGDSNTISNSNCKWNGETWANFINHTFDENDLGNQTVEISYTDEVEKTVTLSYSVLGITKLALGYSGQTEITEDPSDRYVGQTYPDTIQAVVTMSDGTTKEVTADVTSKPDTTTSGNKQATISYSEGGITKTTTYTVNVLDVVVVSIDSIASNPTNTKYKTGETFSKDGLEVVVSFNDGSTTTVVPDSTSLDGHVFGESDVGTPTYSITVADVTTSASYSVTCIKVTGITITGKPGGVGTNGNEFNQGDAFDVGTLAVTKTYSDGTSESDQPYTSISPNANSKLLVGGANTVTITVTEGDVSVTATTTIYVKAVSSIYLADSQGNQTTAKDLFNYGESFSLGTGVKVMVAFAGSHFADEELSSSQYTISYALGTAITQKTTRTITISYGVANPITYTIHVRYLQSIELSNFKTSFYQGDYFEYGVSASITAKYYSTKTEATTSESISVDNLNVACNYNPLICLTSTGSQTVQISYTDSSMGLTEAATYSILVVQDTVSSLSLSLAEEQVKFGDGDDDPTYYINVSDGHIVLSREIISETDNGNEVITVDDVEYTITSDGTHYTFTDGDSNSYTSTSIGSEEGYTKFYASYTMFYKSAKALVTANYASGKKVIVATNLLTADKTQGMTFTSTGTQTITLSYEGKSVSYSVTVVAHTIESISIDYANTIRNFAIGDKFSNSGLVVKAVYNSGYRVELPLGTAGYQISPAVNYIFIDSDYGTKTVTVSYGLLSATYTLTISYPTIDHFELDTSSIALNPKNGDVWSSDSLGVSAVYTNGLVKALSKISTDEATLTKFYVNASTLNLDGEGKITLDSDKLGSKIITVKAYGYYQLTEEQSVTFNVAVLPNGALQNIYVVLKDSSPSVTYRTGDVFTGKEFVIMAKYLDYKDYVEVPVEGNANVITSPAKGSTIYKAGQLDIKFKYVLNNVVEEDTFTATVVPSYSKNEPITKTLKIVRMLVVDPAVISLQDSGITQEEAYALQKNNDGYLWLLFDKNDTELDTETGQRVLKNGYVNIKCYGYVISGSRTEDTDITVDPAEVFFFDDYVPPVEGESNIEVLFKRTVKGNADKINYCRDITLYGYKTYKNRAFVSGNTKVGLESTDFHSEPVNFSQTENYEGIADQDLTYFPDTGYTRVGNGTNKIIGEEILNNGYMMILKSESKQEPTIYFRHCELGAVIKSDGSSAFDANGNQLYEERYEVEPGNMGDGGLNKDSLMNFYGDTLFLTKKGLMGIDVGNATSLTDNTKYATGRSYLIDKKLKKANLENAFLYKYGDYLLLATDLGVFVANYYDKTDKQYEWMLLGNIKARIFFEYDDELYFGTEEGEICKFKYEDTYKDYTDKPRTYIGNGGLLPLSVNDTDNANKIVFNYSYADEVKEGAMLSIIAEDYTKHVYALVGNFVNVNTLINNELKRSDFQGLIDPSKGYFKFAVEYDRVVDSVDDLPTTGTTGLVYMEKAEGGLYKWDSTTNKYVLIGSDLDSDGYTRTQQLNRLLVDNRVVYIDQLHFVDERAENRVGEPYKLVTKDAEGEDLPPYCFLLLREDGVYADLNNLEKCRISFQVQDNSIITNVVKDSTNSTCTCQLLGDHDLILDLIQYDNQNTTAFRGVITKKEEVKAYYVAKPLDFDQPLRYKNIFYWLVVNDSSLASHTDLGYLINSAESLQALLDRDEYVDLGRQLSEIEADLGKMSLESWTFDVNNLPKYHKSDKTVEDIENIVFVFKNFDDTNIVLTNLTVEYTVGITIGE